MIIQEYVTVREARIPSLGLGTYQAYGGDCKSIVTLALGMGYRHVDTAQIYENEGEVGTGIKASGVPREEIFLTTKIWFENYQPAALKRSLEQSLRKLQTERVDLLLLHWPKFEREMEFTLDALMEVQEQERTVSIGVSNFTTSQMERAQKHTSGLLVTNQVEYHPFLDQSKVLKKAEELNMSVTAYCPIARGKVLESELLQEIAKSKRTDAVQVSLAWLRQQKQVIAIPKTVTPEYAESNLKSLALTLSEEEMEEISKLGTADGRLVDPSFAPDWD